MKYALLAALLFGGVAVQAADGAALAAKNGCLACHAVDHKIIGPAYRDVATRYRNDKGAAARLAAKVKAGGSGTWGVMTMPPQPVGEADLKVVLDWVLSQK